jgi:hypothetical protein
MARVKLKSKEGNELVGKAIFDAWDHAIKSNPEAPAIDREALIANLTEIFDLEEKERKGKKIEFDVVFDTDLDEDTRLVWISIPTPDVDLPGGNDTWEKWKQDYYDKLSPAEKKKKQSELGAAVLFACGR